MGLFCGYVMFLHLILAVFQVWFVLWVCFSLTSQFMFLFLSAGGFQQLSRNCSMLYMVLAIVLLVILKAMVLHGFFFGFGSILFLNVIGDCCYFYFWYIMG